MRGDSKRLLAGAVTVLALAGCSTGSTSLDEVTTGQPSSASSSIDATSSSTTSATTATTAAASAEVTQVRQPLPAGLAADTTPLTDAYFAYWDFATKAYGDPAAADVVSGVGTVATGDAAALILSDSKGLAAANQHLVGTVTSTVKSASVSGAAGTVCAASRDLSYPVDASGKPAAVALPRDFTFKADLVQNGPSWRVQKIVGVQSC